MDMHSSFKNFDSKIKLTDSKRDKLKGNRNALREKIREYMRDNRHNMLRFFSQGSFVLQTNINPIKIQQHDGIKEKYDLDDGIYFICPKSNRNTPDGYHGLIRKAVAGHTSEIKDKNTCIRVVYADGHHIDLPIYWMESLHSIPQLAHKSLGYIESDPKAFQEWVKAKISNTNQLRSIIHYLKAWKDYRENKNSSLKLPSGFILTILACNHYARNERDDLALIATVQNIYHELDIRFTCYRPTVPTYENLLDKYDRQTVLSEIRKFGENAENARNSNNEQEACQYWQKIFGDRFSLDGEENKSSFSTGVNKPWLSIG